jgi:hypothetical protein
MLRGGKMIKLGLLAMIAAVVVGCAAGGSHFRRTLSVADTFENYELIPGYSYYISGSDSKPLAIVGLDAGYSLSSPDWRPVQPDSDQLRKWVDRMVMQPGAEFNTEPNGARILDPQGNQIGVWYSVWDTPRLTFQSENVVAISRPMTIFPSSNRNRGNDGGTSTWPR